MVLNFLKLSQKQAKTYSFVQFVVVNTNGLAIESVSREDVAHTMVGLSHISVKSVGECCCRVCPQPNPNEIVRAGFLVDFIKKKFE